MSLLAGRVLLLILAEAEMDAEVCLCTQTRLVFPLLTVRSLLSLQPPFVYRKFVLSMGISKLTDKMETITNNKQTIPDIVTPMSSPPSNKGVET